VVAILEQAPGVTVAGCAANLAQARVSLPAAEPDVAVLDVRLPDGSGLEYCREVRSASSDIACIMFTTHDDDTAMVAAAIAGAAGYVLKDMTAGPALLAAIDAVAAGRTMLTAQAAAARQALEAVAQAQGPLGAITAREDAIRELLLADCTNQEISRRLHLSDATVRAGVASLLAKTLALPPGPAARGGRRRRDRHPARSA
jgi:two-component system response regulator DevR